MNKIARCKPLLGTYVEISITADMEDKALLEMSSAAFNEIELIQQLMGFHNPDTELSQLNRKAHLKPCLVSPPMKEVLEQALWLSRQTNGVFDITVAPELIKQGLLPDVGQQACGSWQDIQLEGDLVFFNQPLLLDLGGIAKGYAVDCALAVCDSRAKVMINAGGDLRMSHWQQQQVGVRDPGSPHGELVCVEMKNSALATSASYFIPDQRQGAKSALICPSSRMPIMNNNSVSVFAPSCMLADALTKIVALNWEYENILAAVDGQALVISDSSYQAQI